MSGTCSPSSVFPTARRRRSTPYEPVSSTGRRTNYRWQSGPGWTYLGVMSLAIITGASRGLGLALARALAKERWALVIDARGIADLERAKRELSRLTDVVAIPGDIADPSHRG